MIKSPLRYPGGKSRAVEYLYKFIPEYREFREPFFGGGSLSFYCIQKRPAARYVASDINYDVYCFWKELQTHQDQVIEAISNVKRISKDGKALFQELIAKRKAPLSDFQRAVDFFILNRITFSGVVDSGGYSESAFHNRFTLSSIERLYSAHQIIQSIEFSPLDYTDLLFKEGDNVFIFLDPPYYSATKSKLYGKKGCLHVEFQHAEFFDNLKQCRHRWLITYDSSDYIRQLFRDFEQREWELQYGMNNYKQATASKGKELLIANYELSHHAEQKTSKETCATTSATTQLQMSLFTA